MSRDPTAGLDTDDWLAAQSAPYGLTPAVLRKPLPGGRGAVYTAGVHGPMTEAGFAWREDGFPYRDAGEAHFGALLLARRIARRVKSGKDTLRDFD